MDPQATLRELLAAVGDRDWDRVEELSEALLTWLQRRGFPPQTVGPPELGRGWHRAVAEFICYLAKSSARDARKRRRKGVA
jgi:hypothetical protein